MEKLKFLNMDKIGGIVKYYNSYGSNCNY